MKQILSLGILGAMTMLYIMKKVFGIIFFPAHILLERRRRRIKTNYMKRYESKGLIIIDFSEFMRERGF